MTATPTPARCSPIPSATQTPSVAFLPKLAVGSGTKWVSHSTPSTPKLGLEFRLGEDVPSPRYEPTSPVLQPAAPLSAKAKESIAKKTDQQHPETPNAKRKLGRTHGTPRGQAADASQAALVAQPTKAASPLPKDKEKPADSQAPKIKDEAGTPQPTDQGDTTADESVAGRTHTTRSVKRKRDELTPSPAPSASTRQPSAAPSSSEPPSAPAIVLWTRHFNKVCFSAMEQIIHHRSANMFAAPIREKDAPGYHKIVKHPQDLKSIRAAINHGNRAATQIAQQLAAEGGGPIEGGNGNASSVWMPRVEDLVPPKSIINSSQLDRELAHMFANAIMYNPDPHHGPGSAFLRSANSSSPASGGAGGSGSGASAITGLHDSVLGYKVDEFGVVNDTRAMFVEVEKLLAELRSAEVRAGVPPPSAAAAVAAMGLVRRASVAASASVSTAVPTAGNGSGSGQDKTTTGPTTAGAKDEDRVGPIGTATGDEATAGEGDEAESTGNPVKRRRVARS